MVDTTNPVPTPVPDPTEAKRFKVKTIVAISVWICILTMCILLVGGYVYSVLFKPGLDVSMLREFVALALGYLFSQGSGLVKDFIREETTGD